MLGSQLPFVLFVASAAYVTPACAHSRAADIVTLELLGRYETHVFDRSAAEIAAYDRATRRLFVVDALSASILALDIHDPSKPTVLFRTDLSAYGAGVNSVAVSSWGQRPWVAAAVEGPTPVSPGSVVLMDMDGNVQGVVEVGVLPDMLCFTPDGRFIVTADEGQPMPDYSQDPEGTVSIIAVPRPGQALTQDAVRTVDFRGLRAEDLDPSIIISGPGASVAQDLEPEYVAISPDSRTAWVALQENNAIVEIDIRRARINRIFGLGFKDHNVEGQGLDASDRDGQIRIRPWPVFGMYQPDAIAVYEVDGQTYIVTANEGDARTYRGFDDTARVKDLTLDTSTFPNAGELQKDENLGRLLVSRVLGDENGDGRHEALYAFGARSMSIFRTDGTLVYDSGDLMERTIAQREPVSFNSNHTRNSFDNRSDDKGPEPEGVALGEIDGRTYAFVGAERQSGIFIFDITRPQSTTLVGYSSSRDFSAEPASGRGGDLGPEGVLFIAANDSPTGEPLLVVAYEVSGTVAIYQVVVAP